MIDRAAEIVADLRAIEARRRALDRAEVALLRSARANKLGWAEIADALSLGSRQAAEQRYRRMAERVARASNAETEPRSESDGGRQSGELGVIAIPETIHPTRLRLIGSAAEVLSERGYASTRLSDIAERAGIQPGGVYYHYRSKDLLIEDVMRYGVALANQAVVAELQNVPEGSSAQDRLKAAIAAHIRVMLSLDAVARAQVTVYSQLPDESKERVRPMRRANARLWRSLVADAVEEGTLRPDVDPFLLQIFIVNTIDGILNWSWRVASARQHARSLARLVLEGVGV
ncbi:TetR/AcrR family transcriptional regulator [Rhodococcus opacus]|uniref:TetR/AcrR family transcriptional regulator n=1 Tax=Rhodococcus opacus TaxID=37919 RepID=UPI000A618A18|nr:TetR/AcrR family transcriptional regulator [Rhodococcus opacus]UDH01290.1 TetR/AcrR family transcriptional regulator [Rhodococcus opacus PD630]